MPIEEIVCTALAFIVIVGLCVLLYKMSIPEQKKRIEAIDEQTKMYKAITKYIEEQLMYGWIYR